MDSITRELIERVVRLTTKVEQLEKDASSYVKKEAYIPVERLVYGATGVILVGFLAAVVALVMK